MYRKKLKPMNGAKETTLTLPQIEAIAELATEIIKNEFTKVGFKNPPQVTSGIVHAVLDAMKQEQLQ